MGSNYVGQLQERAQAGQGSYPLYELMELEGESHCPTFTMQVAYSGRTARGSALSKKAAKAEAARAMLAELAREGGEEEAGVETEEGVVTREDTAGEPGAKAVIVAAANSVGELQELCIGQGLGQPVYQDVAVEGPDHRREFTVACVLGGRRGEAKGNTKKLAKKRAAALVLEEVKGEGVGWREPAREEREEEVTELEDTELEEPDAKEDQDEVKENNPCEDQEFADKMKDIVIEAVKETEKPKEQGTPYKLRSRNT